MDLGSLHENMTEEEEESDETSLELMSRIELQQCAKQRGIRANQKNIELIRAIRACRRATGLITETEPTSVVHAPVTPKTPAFGRKGLLLAGADGKSPTVTPRRASSISPSSSSPTVRATSSPPTRMAIGSSIQQRTLPHSSRAGRENTSSPVNAVQQQHFVSSVTFSGVKSVQNDNLTLGRRLIGGGRMSTTATPKGSLLPNGRQFVTSSSESKPVRTPMATSTVYRPIVPRTEIKSENPMPVLNIPQSALKEAMRAERERRRHTRANEMADWEKIASRSKPGQYYYWNTKTQKASWEMPSARYGTPPSKASPLPVY